MNKRKIALILSIVLGLSPFTCTKSAFAVSQQKKPIIIEAEDGVLNGVNVENRIEGYSGSGYVNGFDESSDSVMVKVNVEESGYYELNIGYSAPYGQKINDLYINGTKIKEITFAETNSFNKVDGGIIYLNEGTNEISIQSNWGWLIIDYFKLNKVQEESEDEVESKENALYFEAEDADLYGVDVNNAISGYSGSGYVENLSQPGDYVEVIVDIEESGLYDINVGYNAPYGDKVNDIYVDGNKEFSVNFKSTQSFDEINGGSVFLSKGTHTIKLQCSWGWILVDYLKIQKSDITISTDVSSELVNKNATEEAKNVMSYLSGVYGSGILSGVYAYGDKYLEIDAVKKVTGKYPAVLGLDFMDYTQSRIDMGAAKGTDTKKAIEWWNEGGLVTMSWHWSSPTGVDMNNKWGGFMAENTSFNFAEALEDESSEEYKLLINDIDTIADELMILQEAGVPVLWRPLHEAAGQWFWWGNQGSENYKKLWNLLYDRLVNYHGLNNLIWVWNGQSADWYPGDDTVDIVGEDIYTEKKNYSSQASKFYEVMQYASTNKPVALTENGVLPDVDNLISDNIPWLWQMTWGTDFIMDKNNNYSEEYTEKNILKKFYSSNYTITRDELPSFKY